MLFNLVMKFLILLVVCAAAFSVPLDTQNDSLAELLQKVLEANPEENDIGSEGAVLNKNSEDNKELVPPTETPLPNDDILAEVVDAIKSSLADSIDKEISKVNATEKQTKIKEEGIEQITEEQKEEQTTIPSTEELINNVDELPRIDDVFSSQTDSQYEDTPVSILNNDNSTDYDGDIFGRLPEEQHNWTSDDDSYSPDSFGLFQPISKDYEDHMTMLENPLLSPFDTLPLDPSLMESPSMDTHHEHMNPDYPFYDYMDETGVRSDVESHNSHVGDIEINPNETLVMEDTLPTEDVSPTIVESNNESLINEDAVTTEQILTNDEIPERIPSEINENQQSEPMNMMENNSDILNSDSLHTDEQFDMFPIEGAQNFDRQMEDFDYNAMNMNNDHDYTPYNAYSSRKPFAHDQFSNMEGMDYNPYTDHQNNLGEMLYRSLWEEYAYRMNHDMAQNYYQDDTSSIFNPNMNMGDITDQNEVNYEAPVSERMEMPLGKAFESNYPQMEGLSMQDGSLSDEGNNNVGQVPDSTDSLVDFTPMVEVLPRTSQNPAEEIPSNFNGDYSVSNNYNENKQDMSLLLYNSLLRNLGEKSLPNNMIMNPYLINPMRRNYVPLVVFIDSANKNGAGNNMNEMSNSNQEFPVANQINQVESSFINDDGTLLTDIEHDVNIPYSPGYHPAFYTGYNNVNQYHSGYKPTPQPIDISSYPYTSNGFPSRYDHFGEYFPRHQYRNRNYNAYADYLNMQSQRNHYRRDPMSYLHNNYYYYE